MVRFIQSRLAALGIAMCLARVVTADAQSASAVSVELGVHQSAQRYEAASPYRYAGHGPEFLLGYDRHSPTRELDISFAGSTATLYSGISRGSIPKQVLHATALRIQHGRLVGSAIGARWLIGVDFSAHAEVATHTYSQSSSDDFGFFTGGVGPLIRGHWTIGKSSISNEMSMPILSIVDFPWSNGNSNGTTVTLRTASVGDLRAVTNTLSYRWDSLSRVTWKYNFSYLSYLRGQTYRVARQSVSVAVAVRRRRPSR